MKRTKQSVFLVIVVLASLGIISPATEGSAATGPDTALVPDGSWDQLSGGESQWYAFEYASDGSQVQVRLETVPEGSVGFYIYTPEQIRLWAAGERVEPIGRGSDDPFTAGVLTWSGNFKIAGTYYVVVESTTTATSSCALTVTGSGVTFSPPAPASTTQPATTKTQSATPAVLPRNLTGKLVFTTSYGGPFYTINADGSGLKRIANGIDPTWSPDGKQIAYVSWEEPRGVWVVNSDGTNAYRVFSWNETRYPSWSPDGQEIVFSRANGGGGGGKGGPGGPPPGNSVSGFPGGPGGSPGGGSASKWTLGIVSPADSAFSEPQPASRTNLTPAWSPAPPDGGTGGQTIVFTGYSGLMGQSVDGKTSWQLTTDPRDTSPTWSPDGTKVAYVHRQHDHSEIYVIDVTTGRQTRLTNTPALVDGSTASSVSPAWSPDGQYIAFLTNRTGEWQIWVMAANGSKPSPMFDTELQGLTLQYVFSGERAIDWTQ